MWQKTSVYNVLFSSLTMQTSFIIFLSLWKHQRLESIAAGTVLPWAEGFSGRVTALAWHAGLNPQPSITRGLATQHVVIAMQCSGALWTRCTALAMKHIAEIQAILPLSGPSRIGHVA